MLSEMSFTPQTILLFTSVAVAVLSGLFALFASIFAQSYSASARRSMEQAQQSKVFTSLDRAGHLLVNHPRLLVSVHGLDPAVLQELGEEEAASTAYLFLLLNGFRQYYDERFNGNFAKMERQLRKRPSALNTLLRVKDNQRRLTQITAMYADGADEGFIKTLKRLVEHENARVSAA